MNGGFRYGDETVEIFLLILRSSILRAVFQKLSTTLYTTQPALTKSIKLLEDELGFKLI